MTNEQLKSKIESAANVKIVVTSHKCEGHEGYADAYASDTPTFFAVGKNRYKGKPQASGASYGCRTRMDATTKALLNLASKLGVSVDSNAVESRASADFAVRTM